MPRMSPGVLVDHGSDWLLFVVPIGEDVEPPAAASVIEIGRRSLLVRLIAALGRLIGKRAS